MQGHGHITEYYSSAVMYPVLDEANIRNSNSILDIFLSVSSPTTNGDGALIKSKQAALVSLLSVLHPDTAKRTTCDDTLSCKVLECIKVMAREREGCEPLWTDQGVRTLAYHARLLCTSDIPADSTHSMEAMRCLANILLLEPQARIPFVRFSGVDALATYLQHPDLSLDALFLVYRLIFLVTTNNIDQCNDLIAFPRMATMALEHTKPLVAKAVGTASAAREMSALVLGEIFKVVFNIVTAFENPEDAAIKPVLQRTTQDQIDAFQVLVYHVAQYIKAAKFPSPPLTPPYSTAIHALMNVASLFWSEWYFKQKDYSVVTRVLDVLEQTLALNASAGNPEGDNPQWETDLPPLLILLTRMARAEDGARESIKARLAPESIDRTKHLSQGTSVTAYLMRFMASVALPHVRDTVSELLFACFDDNPTELAAYTGLGLAAGFLVQRGVMPLSLPVAADGPMSADDIDPITGVRRREDTALPEWNSMTEEEKEREADEMIALFEKLNKTGVVKVVPQMQFSGVNVKRLD
ncbi:hypothetical protein SeMB42_g01741 [Synchytrium endobioticum]|uniref:Uncharacterized protein n=1 Tax=Synchytrium endobioticum TaxID=286115 RepID=A0A507DDW6_9FUNG|nr:hypothetical protein SeLEV6574_g01661 [Synchytrium endobioticum]TPX51972.1 hypothetical protein SeMB42_g01741 [Synchytrium endobioticum]